jgi:hypothetical protein
MPLINFAAREINYKIVYYGCGLCGKTKHLGKTGCCGQWICNDESNYVVLSYARNSCARNHRRMTLCGFHSGEGHPGHWQDCKKCRKRFHSHASLHSIFRAR